MASTGELISRESCQLRLHCMKGSNVARLAFKPDSSFFRKIALGAVGVRAVQRDLEQYRHDIAELERGALDTKIWKEVKRKRVRIPDLVCTRCGIRIECRTKSNPELSMSHSFNEHERAWDYGMIDTDYVAFPICGAVEYQWSSGKLENNTSYWHERNWVRWSNIGAINYFTVDSLRRVPFSRTSRKGATEGAEAKIIWPATFARQPGVVEDIAEHRITLRLSSSGKRQRYTLTIPKEYEIFVRVGDMIQKNQLLASTVRPLEGTALSCTNSLSPEYMNHLLTSRERTVRFTGIKLARLRAETEYKDLVLSTIGDKEEDIYVKLEGLSYLVSVGGYTATDLFSPCLSSSDPQVQLEAVIALSEAGTPEAVDLLTQLLDDRSRPYFLRSAAAWCLGRIGTEDACQRLIRAFNDIDRAIREEALAGIVSIGEQAITPLLAGLRQADDLVAAGCAEALRQLRQLPSDAVERLGEELRSPQPSPWAVWLVGHLPRQQVAHAIADLQHSAPQLHYAITLLWSFVESWIARNWELQPAPIFPSTEDSEA